MTKRLLLTMALLLAVALASVPTQAAPWHSTHKVWPTQSFIPAHVLRLPRARVVLRDSQESNQRKPNRQDASLLVLPDSAFSPAVPVQQYTGVVTASDADQNSFSTFHATSYTALGFVTGFYERADWHPAGSTEAVVFRYQGGVFKSSDAAKSAWQDGVTHTQSLSGLKPGDCTATLQATCSAGGFVTQNSHLVFYFDIVINQCLVETAGEVSETYYSTHQAQFDQIQGQITAAGLAAAQAACGTSPGPKPGVTPTSPIDFSLVGLAVHKKRKVNDPNAASVKTVKVGKTVYLYIYYAVRSAPADVKVAPTFTLTRNGGVVVTRSFPHSLLAPAPNAFYEDVPVKMKKPGTYVFTGRLTIADQPQQGNVSFKVVK